MSFLLKLAEQIDLKKGGNPLYLREFSGKIGYFSYPIGLGKSIG